MSQPLDRSLIERLSVQPSCLWHANGFVVRHHRHHKPDRGCVCVVSVVAHGPVCDWVVGVAIIGRPKGRGLQDGMTAEVTRCCTDGTPNVCSMLYGAAWRAVKALGYTRLVTYKALCIFCKLQYSKMEWRFHHEP